jgi:hypothetical protein
MPIPVQNAYISLYFIEIWPFKPCTLSKHVIWISLYPNFPVKTCNSLLGIAVWFGQKNPHRHIKYWPRIDLFFSKNQNFDPKYKIPKINGKNWTDFIIVKFQNFDFLKVPYFCRINSGPIFYMSTSFFWPNHYKKPVFMFMRNYKEILSSEVA